MLYVSQQTLILRALSLVCPFSPYSSFKFTFSKALFIALHLGQVLLAQTLHQWESVEPTITTLARIVLWLVGGSTMWFDPRWLEWFFELLHFASAIALLVCRVIRWLVGW